MKYFLSIIFCLAQALGFSQDITSYTLENDNGNITVGSIFDSNGSGPVIQDNSTVYLFIPVGYTPSSVSSTQGGSWEINSTIDESNISMFCSISGYNVLEIAQGGGSNLGSVVSGVPENLFTLSISGASPNPVIGLDPNSNDPLSACLKTAGFGNTASIDLDGNAGSLPSIGYGELPFTPQSIFLPVELTAFRAKLLPDNATRLDWQTSSETNNMGFEVQRSFDGKSWEDLGFVEGYGTTTIRQNYEYIDSTPRPGVNYYRLRQIDFDGSFEYSSIVSVQWGGAINEPVLFPNPTRGSIGIKMPDELVEESFVIDVYDNGGKHVQHVDALHNRGALLEFSLREELSTGMYFVLLQSETHAFRLRVQKI